jgi:NAD(P)-dependent dehydrogenase (short-subunit alcohol dehydrogenase family)
VTGGARGIGRGIALTLAAEGARVAVNYVNNSDAAEDVVREIRKQGGEAEAIGADVGVYEQAQRLVAATLERFDRVDILVNNAGIVSRQSILDVSLEDWDRVVHTNFYGCFHCSRLVGRHMVARGGGGKIVNISSIHGRVAKANMGPYCSTKAAIDMFSKQLAVELAPHKINVNAVASGTISTDINIPLYKSTEPADIALRQAVLARIPWGVIGEPEDIGRAVAFLASEAARYVTGAVLYVDGGYTAEGTPRVTSGEQVP